MNIYYSKRLKSWLLYDLLRKVQTCEFTTLNQHSRFIVIKKKKHSRVIIKRFIFVIWCVQSVLHTLEGTMYLKVLGTTSWES